MPHCANCAPVFPSHVPIEAPVPLHCISHPSSSIPSGCILPASRSDAAGIRTDVADGLCTAYVSRAILQILTLTLDCVAKRHSRTGADIAGDPCTFMQSCCWLCSTSAGPRLKAQRSKPPSLVYIHLHINRHQIWPQNDNSPGFDLLGVLALASQTCL